MNAVNKHDADPLAFLIGASAPTSLLWPWPEKSEAWQHCKAWAEEADRIERGDHQLPPEVAENFVRRNRASIAAALASPADFSNRADQFFKLGARA